MEDLVLPDNTAPVERLIAKYRKELEAATTATSGAVAQLQQQLVKMERNQVALLAQKALLDTLEKDLAVSEPPDTNNAGQ